MYRSESCVINQKENTSLTAAEMVYLRSVKGCTRRDCSPSENTGQVNGVTFSPKYWTKGHSNNSKYLQLQKTMARTLIKNGSITNFEDCL